MKDNSFAMRFVSEPTVLGGAKLPPGTLRIGDIIKIRTYPPPPIGFTPTGHPAMSNSVALYNTIMECKQEQGVPQAIKLYRELQPGSSLLEAQLFVKGI